MAYPTLPSGAVSGGESSKGYSWGTGKTEAYVKGTVSSTAEKSTVTVTGAVSCDSAYSMSQYGVEVRVYAGGGNNIGRNQAVFDGSAKWIAQASGTKQFTRKKDAYSVTIETYYFGTTVSGYGGCSNEGSVTTTVTIPAATQPSSPVIGTNIRNSDSQNTISWTNNSGTGATPDKFIIERSANGGSWNEVASVSSSATSYIDTTTAEDNSYVYRVCAVYASGWVVYSNSSNTTHNTPSKPASISGARTSGTNIQFTLQNASKTATGIVLEYSPDKVTWNSAQSYSGSPVTSFNYQVAEGGTYFYRIANTRTIDGEVVKSAYTETSGAIVTLSRANAPRITAPASNAVIQKNKAYQFTWAHNPSDGTAQTKAEYGFSVNGGSWSSVEVNGTASSVAYTPQSNGSLQWRVRTAGANGEYSDYSISGNTVATAPSVSLSVKDMVGGEVVKMPIRYEIGYTDSGYQLAQATVELLLNGNKIYAESTTATDGQITASEFIPNNNVTYQLKVTVRSSSSLQAETTANLPINFHEPELANLSIEPSSDTGYCNIRFISFIEDEDRAPASYVNVYRIEGNKSVLIASDMTAGAEVVDKYAPLNSGYQYRAVSFTDTGIAASKYYPVEIETDCFFCYWGENNVASARWNKKMSESVKRPSRKLVYYDGRDYPVLYDGTASRATYSASATLLDITDNIEQFRALMASDGGNGVGVFKSYDGQVFHACFELSTKPNYIANMLYGTVSLSIERIYGEVL